MLRVMSSLIIHLKDHLKPSQTISNPKNAINGTSHTAGLEKQMKQRWTKLLLAEHLEKLQDEAKY